MINLTAPKFNQFIKNERQAYAYMAIIAIVVLFSLHNYSLNKDIEYLKKQNELLIKKNEALQERIIEILNIKNR